MNSAPKQRPPSPVPQGRGFWGMKTSRIEWSDEECRAAKDERCYLCEYSRVYRPAVVLAVVAGFGPDGSGSAGLGPVCAECAEQPNVIPCQGLPGAVAS